MHECNHSGKRWKCVKVSLAPFLEELIFKLCFHWTVTVLVYLEKKKLPKEIISETFKNLAWYEKIKKQIIHA